MRSSRTITLFSVQPEEVQSRAAFLASILVHGAVIGLVAFVILYGPKVNHRVVTERFAVRHLDLHVPEELLSRSAVKGITHRGKHFMARAASSKHSLQPAALRVVAKGVPGKQTLVQPNINAQVTLPEEVPIPTTVIWTPEKTIVKNIVPPKPQEPTTADVQPSLEIPNQEINLADVGITSTDHASLKQNILPSTTTPVAIHAPEQVQMAPVTTSESTAPPTPAAVMSLSDLHMAEGSVTLPPLNETVAAASPGLLAAGQGQAKETAQAGNGNPADTADASKASPEAGGKGGKTETAAAAANRNAEKTAPVQGSESGTSGQPSTVTIELPKGGEFGAVVVGSSLVDRYPETAELWSGRMAYTVYLHVGLSKSWILQYSLTSADDAAAGGDVVSLDAPWPYTIVRPNISPDSIDADALMIRGIINQLGRFEGLSVVFPTDFTEGKFVLNALSQWQFRPATQNGQNVKVDVLLIIPEETE